MSDRASARSTAPTAGSWLDAFPPRPATGPVDLAAHAPRYGWLESMRGTPQSPVHHHEGDVLTHTEMVGQALVDDPEFAALPADRRDELWVAAVLHDDGKPATAEGPGRHVELHAGERQPTPGYR